VKSMSLISRTLYFTASFRSRITPQMTTSHRTNSTQRMHSDAKFAERLEFDPRKAWLY
jgi:hypothetical protein